MALLLALGSTLGPAIGTAKADLVRPGPQRSTGPLYGDAAAAARFWRYQLYDDCVPMAVADVVGQLTGNRPSEQDILAVVESTPSTVHKGPMYIRPEKTERAPARLLPMNRRCCRTTASTG